MIQIITNNIKKYEEFSKSEFLISKIDEFQSFDNYDITIIDISDENLWYYKGDNNNSINQYMDLRSIREAILKSKKSNVLVVFPQNIQYHYSYHYVVNEQKYTEVKKIKDMQKNFIEIINSNLINMNFISLNFGKSYTKEKSYKLAADFSFGNVENNDVILKAENGNDAVVIKNGKTVLTTLKLSTEQETIFLLRKSFQDCFENKSLAPEWIKEVQFYTDEKCKEEILELDKKIEELNGQKDILENILNENAEYKSILYETGEILAKQINKMLSEILEYDISQFKDTFEEDCLIKLDDVTFVIETKGLNNEISGHNISDACNHLIIYEDKLEEENKTENAKCLFIVAYERQKKIQERVKIKERVEKIAKANNTLIVDTRIFLNIFEDFLNNKITKDEIKEIFKSNIGVLEYNRK